MLPMDCRSYGTCTCVLRLSEQYSWQGFRAAALENGDGGRVPFRCHDPLGSGYPTLQSLLYTKTWSLVAPWHIDDDRFCQDLWEELGNALSLCCTTLNL